MRIQAALPTLAELCPHFSWPPVSAYLHLCLPAFGEQCECSQPNVGTEEVTSLLVLINGALISMIFFALLYFALLYFCNSRPQGSSSHGACTFL